MAVLAGIAGVRLVVLVESARLAGGARTVATALRLARGTALAADATTEVRFDVARRVCETRDARGTVLEARSLPPGVGFGSVPARARVLFSGIGTADNATITLVAGRRSRRVVVNQRGRVRLQ
jgi:type II secretion system GspH-like protein